MESRSPASLRSPPPLGSLFGMHPIASAPHCTKARRLPSTLQASHFPSKIRFDSAGHLHHSLACQRRTSQLLAKHPRNRPLVRQFAFGMGNRNQIRTRQSGDPAPAGTMVATDSEPLPDPGNRVWFRGSDPGQRTSPASPRPLRSRNHRHGIVATNSCGDNGSTIPRLHLQRTDDTGLLKPPHTSRMRRHSDGPRTAQARSAWAPRLPRFTRTICGPSISSMSCG